MTLSWSDGSRPPYGTDRCVECDAYIFPGAEGWEVWGEPGTVFCFAQDDAVALADVVDSGGDPQQRHVPKPWSASELIADHTGNDEWLVAS